MEGGEPGAPLCGRAWSAGDKWWWSHQPGSGTSCLPARVTWDKVLGLSGSPLFCNTEDINLLLPTREGPLDSNERPGRCHSRTDGLEHAHPGRDVSGAGWGGHASCPACTGNVEEELPAPLDGLQRTFCPTGHLSWGILEQATAGGRSERWFKEPYGGCSVSGHPQDSCYG